MIASLSSPYALMAWVMVVILVICLLYVAWIDDKASRQRGVCMLAVGLVFGLFCLWVLDEIGVDARELFKTKNVLGWRDPDYSSTYQYMFITWIVVSAFGGIGLHRILVKCGLLSLPDEEDDGDE